MENKQPEIQIKDNDVSLVVWELHKTIITLQKLLAAAQERIKTLEAKKS